MKSLCLKDDTASVSDGMEDDNDVDDDNPHELVPDVIDFSHDDDISDDVEEDEIVMKEHGAIYSSVENEG